MTTSKLLSYAIAFTIIALAHELWSRTAGTFGGIL
jgi:hypothetical protein